MVGEFMVQSRVACALAGAALSILVLTGCQGGEAGAAQTSSGSPSVSPSESETPSTLPAPTPSPASAAGPAVNIPVPEKPALADENSVEGLEAFTEWWFELLNYAQATNDFEPLWAVTDEGCKNCKTIAKTTNESFLKGGWQTGGEVSLESFETKFRRTSSGSIDAYVTLVQDKLIVFDAEGEQSEELAAVSAPTLRKIIASNDGDQWTVLDFGTVKVAS